MSMFLLFRSSTVGLGGCGGSRSVSSVFHSALVSCVAVSVWNIRVYFTRQAFLRGRPHTTTAGPQTDRPRSTAPPPGPACWSVVEWLVLHCCMQTGLTARASGALSPGSDLRVRLGRESAGDYTVDCEAVSMSIWPCPGQDLTYSKDSIL